MISDQQDQEKVYKFIGRVQTNKLILEINDGVTYRGYIEASPYYDINELKVSFQRGDMQVITKTTSKIIVKLGFLKVELPSQSSHEISALKAKIEELEARLNLESKWEEDDLDSKNNFEMNCIYRMETNAGYSSISTVVTPSALHFQYTNGSLYQVASSNRKAYSVGHVVTKLFRQKI